jgi:flagellar basal-body rod protein FlgB
VDRFLLNVPPMKTLFDSVDRLEAAMTFHRERHSVLAGNVANVDTPGYRPLDLERTEPAEGAGALATTHAGHMQAAGLEGTTLTFADADAAGADGNSVSLERELSKIDANRVRYQTSAELTTRRMALIRYGAGDGS